MTPVPDSDSLVGEFRALLSSEILPVTLPVAVGAKVTLKDVLWPVVSVSGIDGPLMLKPAPATLACEIVRLDVPVF